MTENKPFLNEITPEATKITKGTKLNNDKSMFSKVKVDKESFEAAADKYIGGLQERDKQAVELARQFINIIKDKTLPENKSKVAENVERELKNKLLNLGIDINNDENEENDGMGSMAIISLLIKTVLLQRDTINLLDYRLYKLEKLVSSGGLAEKI